MKTKRRGFSLLEVVLAIAILAVAMAALGELLRTGMNNAGKARDLATAQLEAETTMSELMAGIMPFQSSTNVPCPNDPSWLYSVTVEPHAQPDLYMVTVTVYRDTLDPTGRNEFTLVRWARDPSLAALAGVTAAQLQEEAEAAASSETSSDSSSSTDTNSSGGTGGSGGGSSGGGTGGGGRGGAGGGGGGQTGGGGQGGGGNPLPQGTTVPGFGNGGSGRGGRGGR